MANIRLRSPALLPILVLLAGCGATPGLAGSPTSPSSAQALKLPRLLPDDDERIPAGYYKEAEGKEGKALVAALHRIVAGHMDLGYDRARDVLFGTIADADGDDRVEDLYTGEERDGIRDRKTAYSKGMNTEHTWPQSLGAQGAAQADLHHLQPSDIKINGSRGSLPYGEVVGAPFSSFPGRDGDSVMGNSRDGILVFQPRPSVRGDIARGLLYFYTTYAVTSMGALNTPKPDLRNFRFETPVLLKWNQADPPDAMERARNEAVFRAQGNRNPYVDRPGWADKIGL
ncbi:MAG: endonuclease [Candidatus Sericytochromatia bacterium]|nr:endonuclease [Candidatus Tanganyikabacteria bacterium]